MDSIVAISTVGDDVGVDVIVGEAVAVGAVAVGDGEEVGVTVVVTAIDGVGVGLAPVSILSLNIKYPPAAITPAIATVPAVATRGFFVP
jgi:hypothetical protein